MVARILVRSLVTLSDANEEQEGTESNSLFEEEREHTRSQKAVHVDREMFTFVCQAPASPFQNVSLIKRLLKKTSFSAGNCL